MDPIKASQPQSTGDKLARRLSKAGSDIAEGAGKTAHGAAKTIVNAPLAAGEVLATGVVATAGVVVLTAEGAGAGLAATAGVATGLGVDAVELTGKGAQALGNGAEALGDGAVGLRKDAGGLLERTSRFMGNLIDKGFDSISRAFGAGVDAVSPKK